MTAIHRDQVHGDVRFDPLAVALLNTQALQRLGRVYQLGYAHLVYRGGTHTRLSHVMGAHHVAGWLVDQLKQNYDEATEVPLGTIPVEDFLPVAPSSAEQDRDILEARWDVLRHLVRWAALLHDVGHVPLGHTLEDEFEGIYTKHDDFASPRIPFLWNEVSTGEDSEIRRVFRREDLLPESFRKLRVTSEAAWKTVMLICLHKEGKGKSGRISFKSVLDDPKTQKAPFAKLLRQALNDTEGKTFFPYMADIVGNTICADYFDYLRRDAINVGLDVLRDNRVAARFFIGKDANKQLRMALSLVDKRGKPRLDTCTGVVELVRQRFRFAEIIYYHKTKVAASAMLAKVFNLIGTPEEIGTPCTVIEIDRVGQLAQDIIKEGSVQLRKACSPTNLLSPEIGDETLQFWLQERGWTRLQDAEKNKDKSEIERCLRGLSLLQSIVRRKLYKVCFTIDRRIYELLDPGSHEPAEVERKLQETHDRLRGKNTDRDTLEIEMAKAAGWPADTLILYVPPRKSQAKGIETGALDAGEVVTLGEHSAVREEVAYLNSAYQKLWRIILLVHPKYANDHVGLSKAVERLIRGIWPSVHPETIANRIDEAAWFNYIPEKQRAAAQEYLNLISPQEPRWRTFRAAFENTCEGTVGTEEHVLRTVLLSQVEDAGGTIELIRSQYGQSGSLSATVSDLESQEAHVGREGTSGPADVRLSVLHKIATDLLAQPRLFDYSK